MQKTIINPWQWQDQLGYAQAVEISHASHTLYCAGQAAVDAHGAPLPADMPGQLQAALANVETVLTQAGYALRDVVRINYLTTSIADFFPHYGAVVARLAQHGCQAASTLVEVQALAFPGLLVEIEVTAAR
ncbi:RidA family protein [Hymenobacter sp. ASUV-10]|uniref:RidA family protein n=1 Tax=Hymenobacter aranciens TaxID=3063996 RepID=A0ABT9B849_9BACT|nr:RidA family protein [Hymenobacter sp. ASUV-10]MDO7874383.1 RidA family protein [Hymenobacter sp. ASUV-10]